MSLPSILTLSLLLLLSPIATSSATTTADDDTPTPYEIIESYNFPKGILPKGAQGYELDTETGKFKAFLGGSCSFALEGSYQLKYKSTITGTISKNRLTNLTGVSVKILFLWLNIVEVSRSGDNLEFSVGIASAAFPIDNFYECPQCGCGLDCLNQNNQKEYEFKRGSIRCWVPCCLSPLFLLPLVRISKQRNPHIQSDCSVNHSFPDGTT